ncbi:MAG TPA: hypothetical protein VLU25_05210 [Acidobacteriota bacterium]|nr:hypothetical protein [Acidobacteriota bacterium]
MSTCFRVLFLALISLAFLQPLVAQPVEGITFGRVIAGDLTDEIDASTELLLTNRDAQQSDCDAIVFFTGASTAGGVPVVLFNGETRPSNAFEVQIPRGGASKITITAEGPLVEGAVLVAPLAPCGQDSINGTARFVLNEGGALNELYTIAPNNRNTWLRNNQCFAISTCLRTGPSSGFGNNLGLATTPVAPGFPAPSGTILETTVFDENGDMAAGPGTQVLPSEHQAFFPLSNFPGLSDGVYTLVICLFSPDTQFNVDLTTIQVGTDNQGNAQFDAPIFADGFESGDVSAWTNQTP